MIEKRTDTSIDKPTNIINTPTTKRIKPTTKTT